MNETVFFFFYNMAHRSVFFDKMAIFFAVYFIYVVIFLAFVFLFFHHHVLPSHNPFREFLNKWKEFIVLCVSGSLAWVIAKLLKILINTERPFDVFPQVYSLIPESGYAFPSGHTMVAAAIAFTIFFTHKKAGYVFMLFAILIGLARVVAGVHFPSDILGGFIIGGGVSYLVAYFMKNL